MMQISNHIMQDMLNILFLLFIVSQMEYHSNISGAMLESTCSS